MADLGKQIKTVLYDLVTGQIPFIRSIYLAFDRSTVTGVY